MREAFVKIRAGGKEPVFAYSTIQQGTFTVQSEPAPSCILYNSDGDEVWPRSSWTNANGRNADFDTLPARTVRAWYDLDTSDQDPSGVALDPGIYYLVIKYVVEGSDEVIRREEVSVEIWVLGLTE